MLKATENHSKISNFIKNQPKMRKLPCHCVKWVPNSLQLSGLMAPSPLYPPLSFVNPQHCQNPQKSLKIIHFFDNHPKNAKITMSSDSETTTSLLFDIAESPLPLPKLSVASRILKNHPQNAKTITSSSPVSTGSYSNTCFSHIASPSPYSHPRICTISHWPLKHSKNIENHQFDWKSPEIPEIHHIII